MLLLAESHTSLQQQVIYLTGAVLTVMVGIFSLAAVSGPDHRRHRRDAIAGASFSTLVEQ
jgi:hypothetical protein